MVATQSPTAFHRSASRLLTAKTLQLMCTIPQLDVGGNHKKLAVASTWLQVRQWDG
jgi:hypothetical protein